MPEEESSTERFLRLMNEANQRIADAAEAPKTSLGEDQVRLALNEARRAKYGPTLRARPKSGNRPNRVRNAFGHVRIDGSDT